MHTAGILRRQTEDGEAPSVPGQAPSVPGEEGGTEESQLWKLTWDQINSFLPNLHNDVFKPHEIGTSFNFPRSTRSSQTFTTMSSNHTKLVRRLRGRPELSTLSKAYTGYLFCDPYLPPKRLLWKCLFLMTPYENAMHHNQHFKKGYATHWPPPTHSILCVLLWKWWQFCTTPKAGHRSTLRPCVRRFWHRASDYVRLFSSCRVDYAATLFRPVCDCVFANNAYVRK